MPDFDVDVEAIIEDLKARWYYGGSPIVRRPDIIDSLREILYPHVIRLKEGEKKDAPL